MLDDRREPTFEPAAPPPVRAPARRRGGAGRAVAWVLLLAACVAAGWWFLRPRSAPPPAVPVATAPAPDAPEPAPAAEPPAMHHPLPLPPAEQLVAADAVTRAITALVGTRAAQEFLQLTDFPRRFVATLDNLGREHAPVAAWPVVPTAGRFAVQDTPQGTVAADANAARYGPIVGFLASLDAAAVVDLYRRLYPVLQHAWREQGLGDRSLNDRCVEVVALLLATPEPAQAPALTLTQVKGPIAPERPWTRYQFADAQLEGLPAGQKILLRVGPEHRAVLKRKLREVQKELLRVAPPVRRSP